MGRFFNSKGQGLVEFALLLGFVAAVFGFSKTGLLEAAGSVFEPAAVILGAVDHHRTFDVEPGIAAVIAIQANGNYHSGNAGANNINYERGMMRSGWVDQFPNDASEPEIAKLYTELGATQWTIYTGVNTKNMYAMKPTKGKLYMGEKGMFWTVQELSTLGLTSFSTAESYNYSNELVLQYFYSSYTHKYYVVKSRVWLNQRDTTNHIALGGLHVQHQKPAGYFVEGCLDGFDTLLEAKQVFERVRAENGGSVVFLEPDLEHDVSAENHQFDLG